MRQYFFVVLLLFVSVAAAQPVTSEAAFPQNVEVIRTAHGVPHIRAKDLRGAGYALAWVMSEDYGSQTGMRVLAASGRHASVAGYSRIDPDFVAARQKAQNAGKYQKLPRDVRDVYEGFAAGVNRYITLHPEEFPAAMPANFAGEDVAATEWVSPAQRKIRNFINKIDPQPNRQQEAGDGDEGVAEGEGADDGSNAWAFSPSRTKSGNAILLRNPHLQWSAGYYEAQITVPGVLDFYGDFRIGGPFVVIGGFNRDLGFSTTNNQQDLDEIYALDADPKTPDHYIFDGRSQPLKRELVTAQFRNGDALASETREFWSTPLGPVIHRGGGKIYVFKYAGDGETRAGEQFLRMMQAKSLKEWQAAMKMRARMTSNFTYADREGNIYYVWNAALPQLPHPPVDETTAVPAKTSADVWTKFVPFESLPQVLNPPGGYVHNENSSHHYTNVRGGVKTENAFPNFEAPRLSLRTQLAIQLIDNDDKYSLEDVVRLKHNYRALLADRVKADLIAAVRSSEPEGDAAAGVSLLERWDNTTSPESRGSTLFEVWWQHYSGIREEQRPPRTLPDEQRYAKVWSVDDPFNTPRGLADKTRAVESFKWAIEETNRRYGRIDATWGDVHRVRRGKVDVPVGGCGNDLGCFRIMSFQRDTDGKLAASGGDGWVFAVEFGDVPRAYSVLAYGQSNRPGSPYFSDQAEMFAKGEMKKVAFTQHDIDSTAIIRYHPGEKRPR